MASVATDDPGVHGVIGGGDRGVDGVIGHGDLGLGKSSEVGVYEGDDIAERGDRPCPWREVHRAN